MADGGDKAGAGVVRSYRVERRHRAENVGATVGRALSADALDDVGERRIDVVGPLAFDVVELPDDGARAGVDWEHGVAWINRRIVVCRHLGHHIGTGTRL